MKRWSSRGLIAAGIALVATAAALVVLGNEDAGTASTPPPVLDQGTPTSLPASAGRVRIVRNVDPDFAPFITDATPETKRFMRDHYYRMRGFDSFQRQAIDWAPPTRVYQDLYAIYNDRKPGDRPNLRTLTDHPDWVLRDAEGEPMFIPFNCDGETCPQYAADPGNEEFREDWIERALATLERGYSGLYVDDVNSALRVGDANGDSLAPIDPRTDKPMTLADWRRYVAEFTELIDERLRERDADLEIVHNALWFEPEGDPFVQRQLDSADVIQVERGFNDQGLQGGDGRFGFLRLLDHIDFLHRRGLSVVYKTEPLPAEGRDYELASYFLVSEAGDALAPSSFVDPDDYWSGWRVDLGKPRGARYVTEDGLLRRDFSRGYTLVNQPGADPVDFTPEPGSIDPAGEPLGKLSLGPGSGQVVVAP